MTTLFPFVSEWHGPFIQRAAKASGIDLELICTVDDDILRNTMAVVNNDACYSALISATQAVLGAEAAGCKADRIAIPQFCPKCRAVDQPFFASEALRAAAYSAGSLGEGFSWLATAPAAAQHLVAEAVLAADVLLQLRLCTLPRLEDGQVPRFESAFHSACNKVLQTLESGAFSWEEAIDLLGSSLVDSFERTSCALPEVGIVGTAPVVFNTKINNGLVETILGEGCAVRLPYLSTYVQYAHTALGIESEFDTRLSERIGKLPVLCRGFCPCQALEDLEKQGTAIVPALLDCGGGWLLAALMRDFVSKGVLNIIYARSFGCLSGHVVGEGILRNIRSLSEGINLAAIEYDPGTSHVNQVNRIKLVTAIAKNKKGQNNE